MPISGRKAIQHKQLHHHSQRVLAGYVWTLVFHISEHFAYMNRGGPLEGPLYTVCDSIFKSTVLALN